MEALDNVKAMAVTKQVPHLRWSQAPPLPWRRPGSADIFLLVFLGFVRWLPCRLYFPVAYSHHLASKNVGKVPDPVAQSGRLKAVCVCGWV